MNKKKFNNPLKTFINKLEDYFHNASRKLSIKFKNKGITFRHVCENYLKLTYLLLFSILLNIALFILILI